MSNQIVIKEDYEEDELNECQPCYLNEKTNTLYKIKVPNLQLDNIDNIWEANSDNLKEFDLIPKDPGCYWILTDAPIKHCLNSAENLINNNDTSLKIIYNGVSSNLRERSKEHLFRTDEKGKGGSMSGISVDIIIDNNNIKNHIKLLYSDEKKLKLPKICINNTFTCIKEKNNICDTLYLSEEEKEYINNTDINIYFKNGIDIRQDKHKKYKWLFVYMIIKNHSIRDYIEITWRKRYGIPILCSYSQGR